MARSELSEGKFSAGSSSTMTARCTEPKLAVELSIPYHGAQNQGCQPPNPMHRHYFPRPIPKVNSTNPRTRLARIIAPA